MWHARNRSSVYPDCATTRLLPRLRRRIFDRNVQVLLRVWCSTLRECSGQHRTLLLQLWKPNSNCLIRVLLPLRGQGALSVTDPFQPPAAASKRPSARGSGDHRRPPGDALARLHPRRRRARLAVRPVPIREGLHGGLNLYAAAVRGWRVVRIVVTVEHPEGARECGTGASRDGPNSERRRCAPVPGWVP